jgi:phosphoesterase RecJ-like protein
VVRRKDFRKIRGKDEDVDAVADEMRAVKNAEVVVLFREKPGRKLRVSLRSKKSVNVAAMAEIYGGGGHYDVAGCVIPDRQETMRHLLSTAASLIRKAAKNKA